MTNLQITDLGYGPDEQEQAELEALERLEEEEQGSDEDTLDDLSPEMGDFVHQLVSRVIFFCEELWGNELRPYQREMSYRIVESLVLNDSEEITGLMARQSGKSEVVATTLAGCMILFPILAKTYPIMALFERGLWVGLFAPVEEQSELVFSRIVDRLTSDRALAILSDPEIDEKVEGRSRILKLSNGSFCRRQTANPRAKIEGSTYHIIVIDEAQEADEQVVRKSVHPMLAANAGTMVKIGTPGFTKGDFYKAINLNKRRQKGKRSNHFEYDDRVVSKYNPAYKKFIQKERLRLGEDSEEFMMCVAPETRVLTADLHHVSASEVYEGMRLVGFDEHRPGKGLHRNYHETVVEHVWRVKRSSYRVELSDGTTVVSSSEHPWLVLTAGGLTVWKITEKLLSTDRIFKLTHVWREDTSYEAGYLAAAFDGEGSLSSPRPGHLILSFTQKENAMLESVRKHLADKGFRWWEVTAENGCVRITIGGGRADVLRFLGEMRPKRLLGKVNVESFGSIGRHDRRSGGFDHPYVTALVPLGDMDLIAFQTSTRTFVAEGLASHNSYRLKWMLERGMLITEDELDWLADRSMPLVKAWHRSPCVVGIDPARVKDSTVVTVCWVDWDHPDPAGYREHRVLNWLEIHNTNFEEQYWEIMDFLEPYALAYVGVDAQGMGAPFADRMQRLLGSRAEVTPFNSDAKSQNERWTHLIQLIQRKMIVYPGHSKARRTRVWRRFRQQMSDAEKVMKGQHLLVAAPNEREAHDDYVDSLAIACACSLADSVPTVEVMESPFFIR